VVEVDGSETVFRHKQDVKRLTTRVRKDRCSGGGQITWHTGGRVRALLEGPIEVDMSMLSPQRHEGGGERVEGQAQGYRLDAESWSATDRHYSGG